MMMTEICQFLRNWFELERKPGRVSVSEGEPLLDGKDPGLLRGQYYRIVGSVFNDGVHRKGDAELKEEPAFDGSIWPMALPDDLVSLAGEIEAWQQKYGGLDSYMMSPFTGESFAGYSYSKGGGKSGVGGYPLAGWQEAFAYRLQRYKKL